MMQSLPKLIVASLPIVNSGRLATGDSLLAPLPIIAFIINCQDLQILKALADIPQPVVPLPRLV